MNPKAILFLLLACSSLFAQQESTSTDIDQKKFNPGLLMYYKTPAAKWEEALPVGNGRLGAMMHGNPFEEVIQLNEETYWTGGPYSTVVKGGHEKLKEIQKLVFEEKFLKAHNLFGRYLMGYPVEQMKYQSLANLVITYDHAKDTSNYKRWLDLQTGVAHMEFTSGGTRYHQEIFSSSSDQVIGIKISAGKPGTLSFTANLRGVRNQTHSNYATDYFRMNAENQNELVVTGKSADYLGVEGKLKYEARAKFLNEGGSISLDDYLLKVSGANSVVIYFAAATNFVNYKDVSGNAHQVVLDCFNKIQSKSYTSIRTAHIDDIKPMLNRVSFELPTTENSFLPTDKRLVKVQSASDPALASLAYQFGRYVLISSSRPNTQPANLQGIWNNEMNPAWDSKYTTNINTQMNYWAVESANLSEFSEPLMKMVVELADQGSQVAKEHYGARGWVFHQNTDLWRVAAPMDGPTWGTFTVGGAWLVNELWDHYRYTFDKQWAAKFYPTMKGSVEFFLDFLVQHPNGKWLVTNPSTSPENFPMSPGNGRYFDEVTGSYVPGTTICAGSSIDMQIIHDLFTNYMEAASLLNLDPEIVKRAQDARSKLVPPQIGKDGSLQEWADDWGQLEKNHRHFSHMYGLYPGNVISTKKTPQLIEACKKVLEQRGDGGAGWSRAWKVALWARLKDGNRAEKVYKEYLHDQAYPQLFAKCFTPLQVDGTLGMTAGITEMFVQSNEGFIELLPALPGAWPSGKISGVCVRGGFVVDMTWKSGRVDQLTILSRAGSACKLFLNSTKVKVVSNGKTIPHKRVNDLITFDTSKNNTYSILLSN